MHITRDLTEFYYKNHEELRAILLSRVGNINNETFEDHLQEIYLALQKYNVLKKWDASKGTYDRWITTQVCWHLSKDKDKNKNKIKTEEIHPNIEENSIDYAKKIQRILSDYQLYLKKQQIQKKDIILKYLKLTIQGYPKKSISKQIKNLKAIIKSHDALFKDFMKNY